MSCTVTRNPAACTCSTHFLQQPQVGLLYTTTSGPGDGAARARPATPATVAASPSAARGTPARVQRGSADDSGDHVAVRFDRQERGEYGNPAHEVARAVDGIDDEPCAGRARHLTLLLPQHAQGRLPLPHERPGHRLDRPVGLSDGTGVGFLVDAQPRRAEEREGDLVGAVGDVAEQGEPVAGPHGQGRCVLAAAKSGRNCPYPSASSRSSGMNRSAAEFMQ